jgi:hypothetical protein
LVKASSQPGEARYQANLRYFDRYLPGVSTFIRAAGEPISKIVWEGDRAVDIDLGSGRLYKKPVQDFVREQLDAYFKDPERVILNHPEGVNIKSEYALDMLKYLTEEVLVRRNIPLLGQTKDSVGFLLIVGVGLGLHIEELIDRTKATTVVIAEPIAELLRHSLHVVDWAALCRKCKKNKIRLVFTNERGADQISAQINSVIRDIGSFRLDGSYLFTHYLTHVTSTIKSQFKETAPYNLIIKGWFEDEVDMILNASANFFDTSFRMVSADPLPQRDTPAFIIASGPSLDRSIETVKKWRNHAIIFSSGSSLQALLRHGIVPDYHVELENVPAVIDMLEHMLDLNPEKFPDRKFKGVKLIASTTVNAKVPPYFDESYLYVRDTVSSSNTFSAHERPIRYAAPNVSNTSTCLAAVLGFRNIFFFGCDCGWRDSEHHHSKSTAYYTSKQFISGSTDQSKKTYYQYRGNFGGMVNTDILLNWNREMLETVIQLYRLNGYNCSDGVLIKGAAPTLPETVEFTDPPLDKEAVFKTIRDNTRSYPAGAYLANYDLEAHVKECDAFAKEIASFVKKAKTRKETPEDFYGRLLKRSKEMLDEFPGPARTIEGTLAGIPMVGLYFFGRIEDPVVRREVYLDFLDKFIELLDQIAVKNRELFQGVAERGEAAKKRLKEPATA